MFYCVLIFILHQVLAVSESTKIFPCSQICSLAISKKSNYIIPESLSRSFMNFSIPDGVKNGLSSGLASIVVKTLLQPFDTIKTMQQFNKVSCNAFNTFLAVVKERGILGLWSGISITVIGSTPSIALYFGLYSSFKVKLLAILPPNHNLIAVALAATFGNSIASILRVPYEVIKQRIQAGLFNSPWDAIKHSIETEGPLGLFVTGKLAAQIARDVPYAIITIVTYEFLQSYVAKNDSKDEIKNKNSKAQITSVYEQFQHLFKNQKFRDACCGAIAGGVSSFLTTPLDVVKTRLMTSNEYNSVFHAIQKIAKEEGLSAFFKGVTPRVMHKVPANGLFFLCYEIFRSVLCVTNSK